MTVLIAARRTSAPSLTTPPKTFLIHLGLIAAGVVMFYPLAWMLGASFRDDSRINDAGIWPGSAFTVSGYTTGMAGLSGVPFWRFIANSILVSTLCVAANLIACSVTAYAFARIEFRLKKVWFAIMLGSLMLPHHVLLIPQYISFRMLDWTNTYLPFVVPKLLATDAFFVFLLVQFFRAIPREIDEAARVDGCGHFGIFTRVILPLSKPALATTAIFSFIYSWNDSLLPCCISPIPSCTPSRSHSAPSSTPPRARPSARCSPCPCCRCCRYSGCSSPSRSYSSKASRPPA